jgi:hypothetical protein
MKKAGELPLEVPSAIRLGEAVQVEKSWEKRENYFYFISRKKTGK